MLKKKAIKNIIISISCLSIFGLIYLFPNKNQSIKTSINKSNYSDIIYLLDNNNYISRVSTILTSKTTEDKIKEIINTLTIGSNIYIREGFNKIIPKSTKLLNMSIENNLVKLNFNEKLLNIDIKNEEKMIESIVYSITSLKDIKYVSIYVNNTILNELPKSKKRLNTILDRKYGINKEFNVTKLIDTSKTTIFYLSKYKDYYYYVPITKITNSNISKIEIIIKELSSTKILNTNLISYLNNNTELLSYNETDKSLLLNFNDNILSDINEFNIEEEVTYSINLSIKENYNINEVLYYVNDKIISTFSLN